MYDNERKLLCYVSLLFTVLAQTIILSFTYTVHRVGNTLFDFC